MATLSLAAPSPSAPRAAQAATDALARLLATENIRVEHQPVPTAMFDTASRTLVLPVWRGMSQDLYDMLVGHEVGHALWTPASDAVVTDAIKRVRTAGAPSDVWAKSLLNIVEDARIERKIKEKFPGIRRNFTIAYRELIARDIFGLAGGDPSSKGFVDRFNLYHKCGALGLMQVAFDSQEQALVNRGQITESFEDVVRLCEDICAFMRDENDGSQQGEGGEGKPGKGKPQQGDQQGDADADSQGSAPSDDAGEQGDAAVNGQADDADADTERPQGDKGDGQPQQGKQQGKPQGEKSEEKPGEKGEQTAEGDPGTGRSADKGSNIGENISTDSSMTDGLGKMADTRNAGYYNQYGEAPKFRMDRLVVTAEDVIALWRDQFAAAPKALALVDSLHAHWLRDNQPTILNMVKRFEQRKAADDAKRTMTAKSGRIDTSRLAYYKVSEDLFLSMTTTTDGKSHGLVMVVDWSGSMSGVLGSVVSQVLCLVEFCRKAGVPYEVYAFSDCVSGWKQGEQVAYDDYSGKYEVTDAVAGALNPAGFRMVQFLRSGMSRADHADAVRGLISVMAMHGYAPFTEQMRPMAQAINPSVSAYYPTDYLYTIAPGFRAPQALSLNGTPLNEALLACADIVEAFRKRTGAQIVNLAVLTDGEASRSVGVHKGAVAKDGYKKDRAGYDRYPAVVLRWGSKQYSFVEIGANRYGRADETNAIIRYLRDRTGARCYGFFLASDKSAERMVKSGGYFAWKTPQQQEAAKQQLDTDGSCIVPHAAYDEYYLVGIDSRTESEDFMDRLDTTALSARKIASSFAKGMAARSTSRTIMVRFTDCFATGKPSQHTMR
jgi:cobalamin biosynthesis protein CobT